MIDPFLLTILACPKCRGKVRHDIEEQGLACDTCRLVYKIRDGVPVMLADQARVLPTD